MTASANVLLVAPTARVAATLSTGLLDAGHKVTVVTTFQEARQGLLNARLDLLISEVRLGEFNGLHLALRARSQGINAIIVGKDDRITRQEAESLGAGYLTEECGPIEVGTTIRAAATRRRGLGRRTIHAA